MSSCYSPVWRRFLQKRAPWLFTVCPEGNYHWRWDKWCVCGNGIYNLKDKCAVSSSKET